MLGVADWLPPGVRVGGRFRRRRDYFDSRPAARRLALVAKIEAVRCLFSLSVHPVAEAIVRSLFDQLNLGNLDAVDVYLAAASSAIIRYEPRLRAELRELLFPSTHTNTHRR